MPKFSERAKPLNIQQKRELAPLKARETELSKIKESWSNLFYQNFDQASAGKDTTDLTDQDWTSISNSARKLTEEMTGLPEQQVMNSWQKASYDVWQKELEHKEQIKQSKTGKNNLNFLATQKLGNRQ